jgi:hypothetical protein
MKVEVREAVVDRAAPAPPTKESGNLTVKAPRKILGVEIADLLWLVIPVAFSFWALRSELINVPYLNDGAMHKQLVRWADALIQMGRVPLDGWYPYLQQGSAHVIHYQGLPHILTAYLGRLIGPETSFHLTGYVLLSLWPVSVYVTARLFSLGRVAAVVAALISPLVTAVPGLGFEWGAYIWRTPGVWSQIWGMVLVGPAMGLSWRAVRGKGSWAAASGALGLTVALHFLTGYLALISLAVWVLARPSEFLRRLRRGAIVAVGALLTASWVLFPLFRDSSWINRTVADPRQDHDSFGARRILGWLVSGEMFDARRWPVLTLLVAGGIALCIWRFRRDEKARCVLGLFVFMLVLYFGRPTLGPALKLLPGSEDLFFTRIIGGVHLAGLLLAGIAGAALVAGARGLAGRQSVTQRRLAAPLVALVVIVALVPAVAERIIYTSQSGAWIDEQLAADSDDGAQMDVLIERAKSLGGGRVYSGHRFRWGDQYVVGFLPGNARLTARDADAVGLTLRTGGLTSDIETVFDESNPAHYELLNVRYLIFPEDRTPLVPAKLIERSGRHVLWGVETTGYLKVIETIAPLKFDNRTILAANKAFLSSDLIERGLHPTVAFGGADPATPTLDSAVEHDGPAGVVSKQFDSHLTGTYGGSVEMRRRGVVMLKSGFDPGWIATVDGVSRPTFMVAPTFVGVEVEPGEHRVRFEYRSRTNYPLLFLIGAVTLATLHFAKRREPLYYGTRRRKVSTR